MQLFAAMTRRVTAALIEQSGTNTFLEKRRSTCSTVVGTTYLRVTPVVGGKLRKAPTAECLIFAT